ncbi:hypothetical protein PACILC2_37850 [Paenibacillus cisolokensis]|uniref:MTTase N-terminal domain-containing protein n=1 Tax=Paenibacillus cisolokensis TaxID=1658519 RepID=A0ABQ4NAL8_9BACL|nr:hypothetical protein PACILC2_37850 [Paenibacillus cisolokensis]
MAKETKDYSKYFDFSGAKVISEDEHGKKIRLGGRDIHIVSEPNYRQEKQRGKEEVKVLYDNAVPEALRTLGTNKKYLIYTYGCQMNEHDTEVMKGLFEQMGYTATEDRNEADVILLNTCAIRENAEDKVFGELGHLKSLKTEKPELILGVCGCMSQEESVVSRILQKHSFVDLIFGTHNIHRLPELLMNAIFSKEMVVEVWSKEGDIIENLPKNGKGCAPGSTLCTAATNFAPTASCRIRGARSGAGCRKTSSPRCGNWRGKASRKLRCSARTSTHTAKISRTATIVSAI